MYKYGIIYIKQDKLKHIQNKIMYACICVHMCIKKKDLGGKTLNKLLRINRKGWGKGQAVEKKKEDIILTL